MAVPSYTTDLIDIADLDSTGGTAVEPSSLWTAGRSPEEADTDFPIQGTLHASLTMNTTGKAGILVPGDTGWSSGDYIFGWIIWLAPGAIADYVNGGLAVLLGDSASVFNVYYVGGNDFGSYPYGGWQNFAVDPEMTPNENAGTPSTFSYVGAGANVLSAVAKGNPLGFDVFRYGRGELRVSGGSVGDGYATFTDMAAENDDNNNRWGLFQKIEGGFKFKGLMYFGYGAAVEFVDSNKNIVIDNAEWVASDFNRIEIHNASSIISWTNISIAALGTVSKGDLEMIDNATFTDTDGVFTDMNTFTYQSNATLTGRTFRRCGLVTQGDAVFTECLFDKASGAVALLIDGIADVTDCIFKSDGTGHAVEYRPTGAGPFNVNWNGHQDSGYATTDGDTGNETILIHPVTNGATINLTVANGATTPTIMEHADYTGAFELIIPEITLTLTGLIDGSDISILTAGTETELENVQENSGTTYGYAYSYVPSTYIDVGVFKAGYTPFYVRNYLLGASNGTLPVAQEIDRYYLE